MTTSFTADGGCACGLIRFRMTAEPIIVHGCPAPIHTPSALPDGQIFLRCPQCFCAVWAHHSALGEAIALVNSGAFDAAEAFVPDVHCYTATRHPWITLPADKPHFAADYDVEMVWTETIRSRIERAMRAAR